MTNTNITFIKIAKDLKSFARVVKFRQIWSLCPESCTRYEIIILLLLRRKELVHFVLKVVVMLG